MKLSSLVILFLVLACNFSHAANPEIYVDGQYNEGFYGKCINEISDAVVIFGYKKHGDSSEEARKTRFKYYERRQTDHEILEASKKRVWLITDMAYAPEHSDKSTDEFTEFVEAWCEKSKQGKTKGETDQSDVTLEKFDIDPNDVYEMGSNCKKEIKAATDVGDGKDSGWSKEKLRGAFMREGEEGRYTKREREMYFQLIEMAYSPFYGDNKGSGALFVKHFKRTCSTIKALENAR